MRAEYIDHMGSDLSVVRAAKVSFADDSTIKGFIDDIEASRLGCRSHSALIRYLAKHNHWTPFSHTAVTLRMKAPVPIRTQCFKHKAGFTENEESRRYIKASPELFCPDFFRNAPADGKTKQGSEGIHAFSSVWKMQYLKQCRAAIAMYENMLDDGVCPEQARFVLPQGVQVNWYWTGNLAAFARFFNQRTDPHAQKEIQVLAEEVGRLVQPLFPVSWEALTKKAQ